MAANEHPLFREYTAAQRATLSRDEMRRIAFEMRVHSSSGEIEFIMEYSTALDKFETAALRHFDDWFGEHISAVARALMAAILSALRDGRTSAMICTESTDDGAQVVNIFPGVRLCPGRDGISVTW